ESCAPGGSGEIRSFLDFPPCQPCDRGWVDFRLAWMTALHVLGTPLLVTDYTELAAKCQQWARGPQCLALDFANTQIVTMRRHEPEFRELTDSYDGFPPDGMPLVWCLNRAGARLRDRVYGPTFMREFMSRVPGEFTHFLLGGSEQCGAKLRAIF